MTDRFAICVESGEYEGMLERWKVYPLLDDADAESHGQYRVIDESGEDYLYPREFFRLVELPASVVALYQSAEHGRG